MGTLADSGLSANDLLEVTPSIGVNMDFSLSTDHEILRDSVHNFAEKEIKPVAKDLDKKEEFSYETMQKENAVRLAEHIPGKL